MALSTAALRQRVRSRKRANGKVRQRALALPLTLAGLFAGGVTLAGLGVSVLGRLKHAPALAIRSVQVRGISNLDPGPLRELVAPLRGSPLASFDAEALHQQLEALPGVESAVVSKVLPDTIVIAMQERPAIARIAEGESFALVDATGARIGPAAANVRLPLLLAAAEVRAADAETGADPQLAACAAQLAAGAPAIYRALESLRREPGAIVARTAAGVILRLPEAPEELTAATARLNALVISQLPGFGPGASLDLRFRGQVWYAPPPGFKAPPPEKSPAPISQTPESAHG